MIVDNKKKCIYLTLSRIFHIFKYYNLFKFKFMFENLLRKILWYSFKINKFLSFLPLNSIQNVLFKHTFMNYISILKCLNKLGEHDFLTIAFSYIIDCRVLYLLYRKLFCIINIY